MTKKVVDIYTFNRQDANIGLMPNCVKNHYELSWRSENISADLAYFNDEKMYYGRHKVNRKRTLIDKARNGVDEINNQPLI